MITVAPTSCPCCGQAIKDAAFKVSLEFNTVISGSQALEVEPSIAEVLFILRQHYPNNVHTTRLIMKVWGAKNVTNNSVRTTVYKARKEAEKLGYTIRNSTGEGYRLAKL